VDSDGKTYYANHESRTTTLVRPEGLVGELLVGWELLRKGLRILQPKILIIRRGGILEMVILNDLILKRGVLEWMLNLYSVKP
jgi:hypothetical protein